MGESWRPVVGYEGLYEVSSTGQVRSMERRSNHAKSGTIRVPGRILKPARKNKLGHRVVNLYRNGKPTLTLIHRIVLEAFVGPCPKNMEGCHEDNNPENNDLSNLRWDTHAGNMHDTLQAGRLSASKRKTCPRGHRLEVPNLREAALRGGRRDCKACARERASARREERNFDLDKSNERYQEVLKGLDRREKGPLRLNNIEKG